MNTAPPAVSLRGLTKAYRSGTAAQVVLSEVDLCIGRGQFIVILGRSGSGKSTLLNLLGAMDRPTAGQIKVNGTDIGTLKESERTKFRRTSLGFIFQAYNLVPTLSVLENVKLPLALNRVYDDAPALRLLEELALTDKAEAWTEDLSGGEQQRVAIARALVHGPELILADEPTGNLDVDTGRNIIRLLDELVRRNGQTLIMATHSREVIGYADRVLTINDRKLVDL
ncbi:MAG: ABC transporter ATP-binding protein [Gammaproteobacteria bacterium]|jgi:putative ABC transport system ATP-binding protein|nr:ABC transporter ATP-binding protein [Gammaproteobacteria bacterium]